MRRYRCSRCGPSSSSVAFINPYHSPVHLLACAGFEMFTSPFLVYFSLLCLLARVSLSVPSAFRHARNLTTNHLAIDPSVPTLDLVQPLNLTPGLRDRGVEFRVPNTYVTPEEMDFSEHQQSVLRHALGAKTLSPHT